jgi:hypothetical protein
MYWPATCAPETGIIKHPISCPKKKYFKSVFPCIVDLYLRGGNIILSKIHDPNRTGPLVLQVDCVQNPQTSGLKSKVILQKETDLRNAISWWYVHHLFGKLIFEKNKVYSSWVKKKKNSGPRADVNKCPFIQGPTTQWLAPWERTSWANCKYFMSKLTVKQLFNS